MNPKTKKRVIAIAAIIMVAGILLGVIMPLTAALNF